MDEIQQLGLLKKAIEEAPDASVVISEDLPDRFRSVSAQSTPIGTDQSHESNQQIRKNRMNSKSY